MTNYEKGGLASVAQSLAKEGRNGDTELVHMSPKEVRGLQALATANGSSLTINPTTGLPEAFNFRLENLIPMAAGAALTIGSGGALSPLMAAGLVGGGYGIATGSIEKGLMAGIGAYGGAGIATGLAEAGANAAANATQEAAITSGTSGIPPVTPTPTPTPASSAVDLVGESYAVPRNPALGYAGTETGVVNPSVLPQATTVPTAPTLANVGRGAENIFTKEGLSAAYKGMPTGTLPATGISLLTAAQPRPSSVPGYQEDQYDRRLKGYRLAPNYQPYVAPTPNPYYRPVYAANGGVMSSFDDEPGKDMAHGGVASLGGYSDGGRMLRGPGDGMSDSIPGVIGGRQPARLADGEFVVPADVVSHLGNGSTEAGAKKLYGMMDKIRQARTGKKRQAPKIKADRYLPMKKMASGGITGYASGGSIPAKEIEEIYELYLGRTPSDTEVKTWQDTGAPYERISQDIRNSQEAQTFAANPANAEKFVTSIYQDQLGRAPDAEGLKFWSEAIKKGAAPAQIAQEINQSLEGQNYDTQFITSLYRQNLSRNPEQAGFQYWLSEAQGAGYTPEEIQNILVTAALPEQQVRSIAPGTKFTELELPDLEADPYGGRYATRSIYDILPDAVNVSQIGGRQAQFVSPVTQQPFVTNYQPSATGYSWTQQQGLDVLNSPAVQAAISRAVNSGAMTKTEYDTLNSDVRNAKSMDDLYTAFNKPKAQVVVDALYGQQMGEAQTLAAAKAEAEQRQTVLNAVDTGYYQTNPQLAAQYKAAGLNYPFGQEAYQGYDTRTTQANVVTPANSQEQRRLLANEMARTPIYKPTYQTINRAGNMPEYVLDPYSDAGLTYLYGRMMNQYNPPAPGFINPATATYNTPTGYVPPVLNNLVLNTPVLDAANPAPAQVVAEAPVGDSGGGGGGDGGGGDGGGGDGGGGDGGGGDGGGGDGGGGDGGGGDGGGGGGDGGGGGGERTGGLLSINRKKQVKPKYKK